MLSNLQIQKTKATTLGENNMLTTLLMECVNVNEGYYHKNCLKIFSRPFLVTNTIWQPNEKYILQSTQQRLVHLFSFKGSFIFIGSSITKVTYGVFSFEIRELKAMYKELLESDNISYSSHIHLVFLFKKEHYYLYHYYLYQDL